MSCLIVSVYNVHSGFRLRSIVTAHMNVLPQNPGEVDIDSDRLDGIKFCGRQELTHERNGLS